ncbi:inositol 2-dehydrogenase [Stappia taiwanensis]|uniref:Inositol 2-dehydrogenase n=1 Tax=Stappia taiwanensis TaxID=992267 RepID=A0A838XV94_9HYPH|nr:inositol 2-dehydrogenase [Stappia taiwanensis]MBA4610984.1 inositol 2-dehydrogenase [Stappia taiwanensis]GGE94275.1 inositol 2-dehydrogenase [Stappia taiwanensis]
MLSIAVIGAGRIGQIHASNLAARASERGDLKIFGIADAVDAAATALAARVGAPVVTAEAALASPDCNAVLIASPTDTHADLIEQAARAGKAIFCEKPVDLSAERIRAVMGVVKDSGVPLFIGFNRRFDPNFASLKARIDDGQVGDVELVTILSRDPTPPPVSYIERSGGLFRDMMIHDFDMARFLLGEEPVEVHAVGSSLVDPAIGAAGDVDTAAVLLRTASGKIAQISNSRRATYGYDQRVEVHGAKGLLRAGNIHETSVELATGGGFTADPVQPFFLERYAAAYRLELDAFLACARGEKAPSPDGEDGLKAQLLADAATAAAQSGQPVRL